MREPFRKLPRRFQIFLIGLILAFLATASWAIPKASLPVTLGLIAIFMAAGLVKPIPSPSGGIRVPNLGVIIVAALLWLPQDVLLGVGVGSFFSLLLFRKNEFWRAASNGALWGLPAGLAAQVAHYRIPGIPSGIAQLVVSSLLAVTAYRVSNISLFALNRSSRSGGPLMLDWFHDIVANWSSQLLSAPLAVVIATIGSRTDSLVVSLSLTALSALGLPIARQELAYYQRSQQMLNEIVEAVVRALEGVDLTARAHGDRVSALAFETGRRLGMSERELLALRLASRLHDVGLIAGHEALADEANLVDVSSQILRRFPDVMIADIVQGHHERWDGKGNRDGRSGEAIPLGARILAVAETHDCVREGLHPYEKPHSPQDTASHLISLAGTVLDPKVVMILLRVAKEKSDALPLAG